MANNGSFTTTSSQGRSLTFNWSVQSQSIANNTTTISWELVGSGSSSPSWVTCGNFKVIINGQQVYYSKTRRDVYVGTKIYGGTYVIQHNSDGTKSFSASAEAGIYYVAVNCSGSGSWSLPQIARYSEILTAPNFNDEQNPTITFTNPSNGYFSLQAKIEVNGQTKFITRDLAKTATSCTFNLTAEERTRLRNQCPNSNTLAVRFTICCLDGGGTEISYSYLDRTMTIVNANPTINNLTYEDANPLTVQVTGNDQLIVQNKSVVNITIPTASAQKGASISSYQLNVNGETRNVSNYTYQWGKINSNRDVSATITVTDSRGNKVSKSITITMLAYSKPTAIIDIQRDQNFYTKTYITIRPNYSTSFTNNVNINLFYKRTNASSYEQPIHIIPNKQKIEYFDNNYDWNIRVEITDNLTLLDGDSTIYNIILPRGLPTFFIDTLKNSVGINCFPDDQDTLQVDENIEATGKISGFLNTTIRDLPSGSDGIDYWSGLDNGWYWYNNTGAVSNMPQPWGFVFKIGRGSGSDFSVLFFQQSSGAIYRKSGNYNSVTAWVKLFG